MSIPHHSALSHCKRPYDLLASFNRWYIWRNNALRGAIAGIYAFMNIHALVNAFRPEIRVFHFRSHAGYECDFVPEGPQGLVAAEVKAVTRAEPRDLKGVEALLSLERRRRGIRHHRYIWNS